MATTYRRRHNLLTNTLGATLATGATSIIFGSALQEGGSNIATLGTDEYLPLTIEQEIVYLTAYTAGATTGTIARGREGTVDPGTSHASGVAVKNAPTKLDIGVTPFALITQAAHGFVVGDVLALSGTTYVKAKADSAVNAEVVGVVSYVIGTNDFALTSIGRIAGLSGLTAGAVYFLSDATAGLLTTTEPTTLSHISKPVLVADSTTSGFVVNMRGQAIGSSAPGVLLAIKQYDPGTGTTYTVASATPARLDSTNLIVSVVAPASGSVLVRFGALCDCAATNYFQWGFFQNGSDVASSYQRMVANTSQDWLTYEKYVTGLTPGTTYSFAWSTFTDGGVTAHIYTDSGGAGKHPKSMIQVWAAP